MPPEGMVHALEITHSLLKPGGLLIDMHPTGEHPRVEVHIGGEILLAGLIDESDHFQEYFQADQALAEATRLGLFRMEQERFFPFLYHAATVTEMADFITAEWCDAVLHDETLQKAEALLGKPVDGREVVVREPIRITLFRALHLPSLRSKIRMTS
jgi:hypothetical protein